jgi:NAD-dependent dihydropyrimidine dehydrogenase PreA subunit
VSAVSAWLVARLFRWLPDAAPTGLVAVGKPDRSSPVIVTANFSLTVARVKRALEGHDVWLLVANADGINVWCAAGGRIFTAQRVIDAIKVSGLEQKIDHREVILPALAAPGIDPHLVKKETGFRARFGPVYARDIPAYLAAGKNKTEAMRRFDFGFAHRLDMFLPMNFPIYLIGAAVLAVFGRQYLVGYTVLFWGAVAGLYVLLGVIPGKTGWSQAFFSATVVVLGWVAVDWHRLADPFAHWGWHIASFAIFFAAGFDLAGTVSARRSDAELMMQRLGFSSFGTLFSEKELGEIHLHRALCRGCGSCFEICPVGVYGGLDGDHKSTFADHDACFACGACVMQCPSGALSLRPQSKEGKEGCHSSGTREDAAEAATDR